MVGLVVPTMTNSGRTEQSGPPFSPDSPGVSGRGTMKLSVLAVAVAMSGGLALSTPAAAQDAGGTEARVAAYFANLVQHPGDLRALMEANGPMPDALWAVTEQAYVPVFTDPAFVPYVVRRMPEYLAIGLTEDQALEAFAGLADAGFLGATRLPQKKTEAFVLSIIGMIEWLRDSSPEFCATLGAFAGAPSGTPATEDAAPFIQAVTAALTTMDEDGDREISRFVTLHAESALAEIRGYPEARSLMPGPALAEAAEAYRSAFVTRISNAEANGVRLAYDERLDIGEMSPTVLCDAITLMFETMWDLPPDQRGTMLLAFLLASTDPQAFQSIMGGL